MTVERVGEGGLPGQVFPAEGTIALHEGRPEVVLRVVNTGDRPVQVGSHFHFAETNPALELDRVAARGMHLAVAAGTSVRFEPGAAQDVTLVPFAGARYVAGFRGAVAGPLDDPPAEPPAGAPPAGDPPTGAGTVDA